MSVFVLKALSSVYARGSKCRENESDGLGYRLENAPSQKAPGTFGHDGSIVLGIV